MAAAGLELIYRGTSMERANVCRWYNESSGVKRAYDLGLIDKKWIEKYCLVGGEGCIRKRRFEEEGYVSPDYVLPDGSISEAVRKYMEERKKG